MNTTQPTGTLLGSYPQQFGVRYFWTAVLAVGWVASIVLMILVGDDTLLIVFGIIAFFLFILVLASLPALFRRPAVMEVYQDGFILRNKADERVKHEALWSEVGVLTTHIDKQQQSRAVAQVGGGLIGLAIMAAIQSGKKNTDTRGQMATLEIHMPVKRKISLNKSYQQFDELVELVKQSYLREWASHATAVIKSGQPLSLHNNVTISRDGVQYKKTLVQWSQIVGATVGTAPATGTAIMDGVVLSYMKPGKKKPSELRLPIGFQTEVVAGIIRQLAPTSHG